MSKVFSAHAVSVDGYTGIDGAVAAARDAAGRPFFQALPEHARLLLLESVPAPDVTHVHYEVAR
jgi:hypothetical protein